MILRVGAFALLVSCGAPTVRTPQVAPRPTAVEAPSEQTAPEPPELVLRTPTPIPEAPIGALRERDPAAPQELHDAWLFIRELGFPDVSGLPYHEVVMTGMPLTSNVPTPVHTHAWVLPRRLSDGSTFVVWWDGLVYATRAIGAEANLRRDVRWALDACARDERPDDREVFGCPLEPFAPLLLYGLGAVDLATRALEPAWRWPLTRTSLRLPLSQYLGERWAERRYARLLVAYSYADDALARLDATWLLEAAPLLQQRAPAAPLQYLPHVESFALELERRIRDAELRPVRPDLASGPGIAPPPLPQLIRALEDVRDPAVDGTVPLDRGLTVRTLAEHGDAAIEPLLDVLVDDTRLARTLVHREPATRLPEPVAVRELALAALTLVIDEGVLRVAGPVDAARSNRDERFAFAERLRAAIARFGHASARPTWLALLSAGDLEPALWWYAARRLVRAPIDASATVRSDLVDDVARAPYAATFDPIIEARFASMLGMAGSGTACRLALASIAWSAPEVRSVVGGTARRCLRPTEFCACVGELVMAVEGSGMDSLLAVYRRWLASFEPTRSQLRAVGAPLVAFADHPEMIAAARWLASSDQDYLPRAESETWFDQSTLTWGDLFELSPVRARVIAELANHRAYGTVWREGRFLAFAHGNMTELAPDPNTHFLGEARVRVRTRDAYAWMVSAIPFAPGFSLAWPLDRRDAAIEEIRAFVQAYRPAAP